MIAAVNPAVDTKNDIGYRLEHYYTGIVDFYDLSGDSPHAYMLNADRP